MKSLLKICFFLFVIACNKPNTESSAKKSAARPGAEAPAFTLKSVDGRSVSLADQRGKVVLLDFWATWCPPCRMSTPALVQLNRKYKGKEFLLLGISLDEDPHPVEPYLRKAKVEHTVLYADDKVGDDYQVRSIPTFYILDRRGALHKRFDGYYPGMEREWEREIELLLSKK